MPIQRAKEEPQAHLETIPLLFIALMPACASQHLFRDYFHGNEDHIQCRGPYPPRKDGGYGCVYR